MSAFLRGMIEFYVVLLGLDDLIDHARTRIAHRRP